MTIVLRVDARPHNGPWVEVGTFTMDDAEDPQGRDTFPLNSTLLSNTMPVGIWPLELRTTRIH